MDLDPIELRRLSKETHLARAYVISDLVAKIEARRDDFVDSNGSWVISEIIEMLLAMIESDRESGAV